MTYYEWVNYFENLKDAPINDNAISIIENSNIDYKGNILKDANVRKLNDNYSLDYAVCEYGFKVQNKDGKYINDICYSNS